MPTPFTILYIITTLFILVMPYILLYGITVKGNHNSAAWTGYQQKVIGIVFSPAGHWAAVAAKAHSSCPSSNRCSFGSVLVKEVRETLKKNCLILQFSLLALFVIILGTNILGYTNYESVRYIIYTIVVLSAINFIMFILLFKTEDDKQVSKTTKRNIVISAFIAGVLLTFTVIRLLYY
jgi:flagellar basal body-associated protein FliL